MNTDLKECAALLREKDNFLILSHEHPDGDTLGCAYALMRVLKLLGKKRMFLCADEIPKDFSYISAEAQNDDIEPQYIVALDVADKKLLGSLCEKYGDKVNLCIDHHLSNTFYAEKTLLCERAAACEIMYELIKECGITPDKYLAECIYTGISTDTGCFRYQNTTSATFRTAAELFDIGIDFNKINKLMFETKTKSLLKLELLAKKTLEYHFDEKVAIITVMQDMYKKSGSNEQECYDINAFPRKIEGVLVGAVIKEKKDGSFGVSVRTGTEIDASEICKRLGGGGHKGASGCTLKCGYDEAKELLLDSIKKSL